MRSIYPPLLLAALTLLACAREDQTDGVRPDGGAAPPADTTARPELPPRDTAPPDTATIGSDGIGNLRLGQSEEEVRTGPVRDTTWQIEGMEERGVVAVVGPGEATVLLSNGAVDRIIVRDPSLLTAAGLGVGATLAQLRAAYGPACAAAGERGGIVVWFGGLPGVSFALDHPVGSDFQSIERDPSLLPENARVRELWVHGAQVAC